MIGIIAAVSSNGIIGVEGKLPFDYPEDMAHFRKITTGSVIIMGRKTFEGIGRALPKRRNIVISTIPKCFGVIKNNDVEIASSIEEAMQRCADETRNIWFIGGASIYQEGMNYADRIFLTLTPDVELRTPAVKFPWINPSVFELQEIKPLVADGSSELKLAIYQRIAKR